MKSVSRRMLPSGTPDNSARGFYSRPTSQYLVDCSLCVRYELNQFAVRISVIAAIRLASTLRFAVSNAREKSIADTHENNLDSLA